MDIGSLTINISDCKLVWNLENKLVELQYNLNDKPCSFLIGILI